VHWQAIPIHIIDFEGSRQTGILEYGIVSLADGQVRTAQTRFCCAKQAIPASETAQHGITDKDLLTADPIDGDWELFRSLRSTGPLGAHHAPVENRFLKDVWPHPGRAPDFMHPGESMHTWGPWVDTHALYKALYPELESHKLSDLIETFELQHVLQNLANTHCPPERRHLHCALYDALASACLLMHLGNLPGFEAMSIPWLLTHSASSLEKKTDLLQRSLLR
tara:strand:+ start:1332 stop:2000 length:669 start_codon:yes stop_codon:yes gene_type:complete